MRQSLIALIRVEDFATVQAAIADAGLPNTNYGWDDLREKICRD